jgi:hypothetical protein
VLAALALATLTTPARAESSAVDVTVPSKLSAWDHGTPRPFVAARIDVGLIFARPAVGIGYGRPHWEWFGAEGYVMTTNSFAAAYAGARASLPFLDFTMGLRDTLSYRRSFLPVKSSYDSSDTGSRHGERARYTALDWELTGLLPAPAGYFLWGFVATTLLGAPDDRAVFDESLRVVMRAHAAIDVRLGYVAKLGKDDMVKAGILTETIAMPQRDGPVVRVGPIGTMALTDHSELVGVFTVVVKSPDTLGLLDGPYGFLGVRYRMASGDQAPAFP